MVAQVARGDTSQWAVMEWVWEQAQYMTATQHAVLVYLSAHSFYRADNPEDGEVGQVLRHASYVASISRGTALKSDAIRHAMVSLQTKAFIHREVRTDPGVHGQQPHRIYVLWEEEADAARQELREGRRKLPAELLTVPTKPSGPRDRAPVLRLVKDPD